MKKIIYIILFGSAMYFLGQATTEHTVKVEVSVVREAERCRALGGTFNVYKLFGDWHIIMSCFSESKELINY